MMARTAEVTDTVSAITLKDVFKSFGRSGHFAICGVNLSIDPGSFVATVGASGSGKTTLLKCINRLVEPDSGAVLIDGQPIHDHDAPRHACAEIVGG